MSDRLSTCLSDWPFNASTRQILLDNFNILSSDPGTCRIFPEPKLVSYPDERNLGDIFIHKCLTVSQWGQLTALLIVPMPDLHAPNFSNYSTRPKGCTTSVTTSPVSLNVVYCTSCCCCHYLYIGETRRQLKVHFSGHLRSIQNRSDWQTACLWFCNCNIIVICFLLCQLQLAKKLLRASYLFFFRTK